MTPGSKDAELGGNVQPSIIAAGDLQLGGEIATLVIPALYDGPCSVVALSSGKIIASFPKKEEAIIAAGLAIKPDGGFGSVEVICAGNNSVTHETWQDWYFA